MDSEQERERKRECAGPEESLNPALAAEAHEACRRDKQIARSEKEDRKGKQREAASDELVQAEVHYCAPELVWALMDRCGDTAE